MHREQFPCKSKVELSISCFDLVNKDVASKSDPTCVVFIKDRNKHWTEVGRTEKVKNDLNPHFSQKVVIDYYFEEVQLLKFGIYDIDNSTTKLNDDDYLGKSKCTLGQIVSNKKYSSGLFYKKKKPAGQSKITVEATEISDNRSALFNFSATKLDKKDTFGKSDPFMEVWKLSDDHSWSLAHRTEVIQKTLNPKWKPFLIPLNSLCSVDFERQIKFVISDHDSDGSHDLIGEFYSTLAELQSNSSEMEFNVVNPKKKAKKSSYKSSGTAVLKSFEIQIQYSFLDYVFGGLQLNFTVGIDFTGSNGDPRSPNSLHFMNPHYPNDYLQALTAVGAVVQDYDTDKMYPALGFGAKIPPNYELSFEFALNFQPTNPYCAGINGVVEAYKQAIPRIQLWGPTNIAPIINHVARFAAQAQSQETSPRNYFILLLLTDGAITDIKETCDAIVSASHLPMSIIIVGVGPADFSAMNMLDGDDGVLRSSNGKPAARDIVQFVPYRNFKQTNYGSDVSSAALAKAVLAEVPAQVTRYYRSKKLVPQSFVAASG